MDVSEVQMNTEEFESVIENCSFLGITREFRDICKDSWPKARLLSALAYWFRPGSNGNSRAIKFRDGLYWVYKTAKQWQAEVGFSEWEFRTALDDLEAMGLVERRSMKASNADGKRVKQLHLSLNKNLLVKMIEDVQATHDYPHAACVSDFPPAPVVTSNQNSSISLVNPPSHPSMSVPQNDSTEGSFPLKASTNTGGENTTKEQTGEEKIKTTGVEKIEKVKKEEILVQVMKKMENYVPESCYYKETSELYEKVHAIAPGIDGQWMQNTGRTRPLTPKERGQLHGLVRRTGAVTYDVVTWTVAHWSEFGFTVEDIDLHLKGKASYALSPNIDFLTKHYKVAVNLYYVSLSPLGRQAVDSALFGKGYWVAPLTDQERVERDEYWEAYAVSPSEAYWQARLKAESAETEVKAHAKFVEWLEQFSYRSDEENAAALDALFAEFDEISSDLPTKWLHDYEAVHGTVPNNQVRAAA